MLKPLARFQGNSFQTAKSAKLSRKRRALAASVLAVPVLGLGLFGRNAQGQTLYWDTDGANPGAGGATPSGNWDDANWSTDSSGSSATANWASGNTAFFSAGTNATGAFTVTLVNPQSATGVTVGQGSPTLTGAELDLSGTGPVDVAGGSTLTINNALGGTAGLTKTSAGKLVLGASNAYNGSTTLSAGILSLANINAVSNSSFVMVANGAQLQVSGTNAFVTKGIRLNGTGLTNDGALLKTDTSGVTSVSASPNGFTIQSDGARIAAAGGTLSLTSGMSGSVAGLNVVFGGAGQINMNSNFVTNGVARVLYDGTGTLVLAPAGNNIITGGITASGGGTLNGANSAGSFGAKIQTGPVPDWFQISGGSTLFSRSTGNGGTFSDANKGITLGTGGGTLMVNDPTTTNTTIYRGAITGTGNFTKAGGSALSLCGTETYSGATIVLGGFLRLRSDGGDGGGSPAVGPGKLPVDTALIISQGAGASFDLGGFNSTVGSLSGASQGTLQSTPGGGSTLTFGDSTDTTFAGQIMNNSTSTPGPTNMRLTKVGSGTTTFTGTNANYNGATTISGGILQVGNGGTTGNIANNMQGNITDNAELVFNRSNDFFYNGVISGTGAVTKLGGGTMSLNPALSEWSVTGPVNINAGTIKYGTSAAGFSNGSTVTIAAGATLDMNAVNDTFGALAGAGTVLVSADLTTGASAQTTAFNGAMTGTGTFALSGGATLTLGGSGSNTYSGATTVDGTLQAGANNALSAASAHTVSGTLDMNGFNGTVGSLAGGGTVLLSGNLTHGGDGTSTNFSGALTGNAGMTKTGGGTFTLSGSNLNTYSGTTTVGAGTLQAGTINVLSPNSAHVVSSGATLDMNGQDQTVGSLAGAGTTLVSGNLTAGGDGTTTTYTGSLSGTGTLTKGGAGTMHVASFNLGGLNVTSGNVHVLASGRNPASTSILASAPAVGATSQLDIEDNALIVTYDASDTTHSVRNTIRNLLKNGRNGAAGAPGAWNGNGGITSSFAHTNGNGFNLAMGYGDNTDLAAVRASGSYTAFGGQTVASNTVLIQMTRGADATLDGIVDSQDVTIIGTHFNKPNSGQWCFGDFDYSGTCDSTDVTTLGTTFGKTSPTLSPAQMTAEFGSAFTSAFESGASGAGAVPEPGTLSLIGLGGLAVVARRRRKAVKV